MELLSYAYSVGFSSSYSIAAAPLHALSMLNMPLIARQYYQQTSSLLVEVSFVSTEPVLRERGDGRKRELATDC